MRAAQTELGERIDRRPGKIATQLPASLPAPDAAAFANTLGKSVEAGEQRATHRRPKRRYKKRVRMPSMLDPHVAMIEGWLAAEPQLTALAIVGRLSQRHPEQFCKKQHSIVQRLLKVLRRKAAERLMAQMAPVAALLPGAVDGAACGGHSAPPTAPPIEQASKAAREKKSDAAVSAPPG